MSYYDEDYQRGQIGKLIGKLLVEKVGVCDAALIEEISTFAETAPYSELRLLGPDKLMSKALQGHSELLAMWRDYWDNLPPNPVSTHPTFKAGLMLAPEGFHPLENPDARTDALKALVVPSFQGTDMQEESKVFYEQYRDASNKEPFGYVLRWQVGSVVNVDIYEIDGAGSEGADGWYGDVSFVDGGDEMREFALKTGEFSPHCAPSFHLYMKYDGTTHLWSSNYASSGGDPQQVFFITDMLRYVTTRAAQYVQERLTCQNGNQMPDWQRVFPMHYNTPTIEVRPFTPE